jgi:hypothetical protein
MITNIVLILGPFAQVSDRRADGSRGVEGLDVRVILIEVVVE